MREIIVQPGGVIALGPDEEQAGLVGQASRPLFRSITPLTLELLRSLLQCRLGDRAAFGEATTPFGRPSSTASKADRQKNREKGGTHHALTACGARIGVSLR